MSNEILLVPSQDPNDKILVDEQYGGVVGVASKFQYGIVKIGNNILVQNGVISIPDYLGVDAIVFSDTAPTQDTVGILNQIMITPLTLYVCTNIVGNVYTWTEKMVGKVDKIVVGDTRRVYGVSALNIQEMIEIKQVLTDGDYNLADIHTIKSYIDGLLSNANALVYKGVIDCSTNPNYPAGNAGDLYLVSVAGKIGGASGVLVETGDLMICNTDNSLTGNQAAVGTQWNVIQKNIIGAVSGPDSSTADNIALFDGSTGKIIKDSLVSIAGLRDHSLLTNRTIADQHTIGSITDLTTQLAAKAPLIEPTFTNNAIGDVPLTVNAMEGTTAHLQDWKYNSDIKAYIAVNGYLFTRSGVANYISSNNSLIDTLTTGTVISRNIADANPALIVNEQQGTGNIANFQFGGANKLEVTKDGWLFQNGVRLLHTFSHPTGSSAIPTGRNVFLGQQAGNFTMGSTATSTDHASYNVGVGYRTLLSNTTGSSNTANGYEALLSNTTGSYNTANGYQALFFNTTGLYNIANGYSALYSNTTGSSNTANGMYALRSNTTGSSNTANGYEALFANTTGSNNTANGMYALRSNTTGANNTANGMSALRSNTTGSYNTANGYQAGRYFGSGTSELTIINNSIFIGVNSRANADNETNEIVIGYETLGKGSNTVTLGNSSITDYYFNANTNATSRFGNIRFGSITNGAVGDIPATINAITGQTAKLLSLQVNSVEKAYIDKDGNGKMTKLWLEVGVDNIAIGNNALNGLTSGSHNVGIGSYALFSNSTGEYNTAYGCEALFSNTTGSYNTANGREALYSNSTGSHNTANGYDALRNNSTGARNTANGYAALLSNTTGSYNTANGMNAGRYFGSGTSELTIINNSVFIGYNSRANADNETNEIVIGYNALGNGSNTATLGNSSIVGYYFNANPNAITYFGKINEAVITNDAIADIPLIVNAMAGTNGYLQTWKIDNSYVAALNYLGQFQGVGLSNYTAGNNATVSVATTGTVISRNIADTNPALKVNLVHASATGDIAQFQFGGIVKAQINYLGYLYTQSLRAITGSDYGYLQLNTNGLLFNRNINDSNASFTFNNQQGTGNIANFQFGGANKLEVTKDGWLFQNGVRLLHTFSHPTGSTAIPTGRNLFIGQEAGNLTMGSTATSTGQASYNVGIGSYALYSNTTGSNNTTIGIGSLYSNTTGSYNTANGYQALFSNTTGLYNIANGYAALYSNTTGSSNTANGYAALRSNTTGINNTANGFGAGRYFGSGTSALTIINNSIFIGANSRANADNETNEIVIGYEALGKGSNTATIGNSSLTGLYLGSATAKLYGLVDYDNTTSGLTASDQQSAIDEVAGIIGDIAEWLDGL